MSTDELKIARFLHAEWRAWGAWGAVSVLAIVTGSGWLAGLQLQPDLAQPGNCLSLTCPTFTHRPTNHHPHPLVCRPSVATVYAPIAYPPLPLLAFKLPEPGSATPARLAATGSLRSCDPDRIVLKKIVLSGYPVKVRDGWGWVGGRQHCAPHTCACTPSAPHLFPTGAQADGCFPLHVPHHPLPHPHPRPHNPHTRLALPLSPPQQVHKSKAVVRFMFHNPEDIRWFRPVELWTKAGRRGRIREPVRGGAVGVELQRYAFAWTAPL